MGPLPQEGSGVNRKDLEETGATAAQDDTHPPRAIGQVVPSLFPVPPVPNAMLRRHWAAVWKD